MTLLSKSLYFLTFIAVSENHKHMKLAYVTPEETFIGELPDGFPLDKRVRLAISDGGYVLTHPNHSPVVMAKGTAYKGRFVGPEISGLCIDEYIS